MREPPALVQILGARAGLGRVGEPEDLARVMVEMLSDDFAWVTAQDLALSGGHLL